MQRKLWLNLICIMATLVVPIRALSQVSDQSPILSVREVNLARVKEGNIIRLRDFGKQPDFLVRPGLLADRTGHLVRVCAESIRLKPGDPLEFPLATMESGKDYESLAISFASALDIHEALDFIGLKAGRGTDPSHLQFWPKGDRVKVVFHYQDSSRTNSGIQHIPVERLVLDTRTSKPLPETGFTFTGSSWEPATEPATGKVYAADAFSPGAISALYNESFAVLDVPRRTSQGEVYTYQIPNPDFLLPSNQLIEITMEPFFKDGQPHRIDCTLTVAPATSSKTNSDLFYCLQESAGKEVLNTNQTIQGFLATLGRLSAGIEEVFVTVHPDNSTPLDSLQKMARLLNTLDNEKGIRIDAPPPGEPYFKAFIPNEQHRNRENRPEQAGELHLHTSSGITTGELVWVDRAWKGDDSTPIFSETRIAITSPKALSATFAAKSEPPAVMLVFAPGTLRYGVLRDYIAPMLQRKMILYIFTD